MRVESKPTARRDERILWMVIIGAVAVLITWAALSMPDPAELQPTAITAEYAASLRITESPDCNQDHFTLAGISAQRQQIEIVATDTRVKQPVTTTNELSVGEEFALASPLVDESSKQSYKIYAIAADSGNRMMIAEATTQPRCGSEE